MPNIDFTAIFDFLWNWRGAFSLCGAGLSVYYMDRNGFLASDVQKFAAFLGSLGFWALVATGVSQAKNSILSKRRELLAAREKQNSNDRIYNAKRMKALENLETIKNPERIALANSSTIVESDQPQHAMRVASHLFRP